MNNCLKYSFVFLTIMLLLWLILTPLFYTKSSGFFYEVKQKYYENHLLRYKKIFDKSSVDKNSSKLNVLNYKLYLDLHPEEKLLKGIAKIRFKLADENITDINLNFHDNFKISAVLLDDKSVTPSYENDILKIPLSNNNPDSAELEIRYEWTPERGGFVGFAFGKINDNSLVYTLNEPNFASTWFPCNDIPLDKALLDISIENDSSYISVSNGILVGIETRAERKIYHWKTLYPISTYLITLYSADYVKFSDDYISLNKQDTMKIEYYVLQDKLEEAKTDFAEHPKIMKFFAEKFGEYPFIKEKYGIAEFLWQLGAMEHQTITGVASNLIGGNNFFLDVYIHELAHHWWGDAVSPKSWKDIWLNEGFASYCEALYFEHSSGHSALFSTMHSKAQENFKGILSEPGNNLFSSTVYNKGAWVLHMLRWEIGDSLFFSSLRAYYEKFKYSNASTEDFINVCDSVSGKDLTYFFEQWLNREGQIELHYEYNSFKKDGTNLTVIQLQQANDFYKFPLEIQLQYDDNKSDYFRTTINSAEQTLQLQTASRPENVILDPEGWLLLNIY